MHLHSILLTFASIQISLNNLNNVVLKIKFFIALIIVCFFAFESYAQELHFSQLSQTQIFTSPAFTGLGYGPRAFLHYRNQYPRVGYIVNSGFNTYYASYDQFLEEQNSGIGVQVVADKFGDGTFSRYHLIGNYAYQARFNEYKALRLGISGSATFQQLDRSKLKFYDQIDPFTGFDNFNTTQELVEDNFSETSFNLSVGGLYYTNQYYFGVSARNLMPKGNFYNPQKKIFEDMTISAQAGAAFWLNEDTRTGVFPYFLFDRQYGYQKVVANVIYQHQIANLGIGGRYTSGGLESITLMTGINFNNLRISYSYDIHAGGLQSYSGGAHEVGLRFLIKGEDNSLYPNAHKNIMFCPDFLRN